MTRQAIDADRMSAQDWAAVAESMEAHGNAVLAGLLSPAECAELAGMYDQERRYRSRIVMAAHGFGAGEYKYFDYPLPRLLAGLRSALYRSLVPIANRWNETLGVDVRYPANLRDFLDRCHAAGQVRPTPLILRYGVGDYNRLHRDLYGEHVFPLQVVILLGRPGEDFEGGEFVLVDADSRQQKAEVVPLRQGDAVVFAVNARPVPGARGSRRVSMRHGVSRIRRGLRCTVGLIFHDAR
jgi:hypothetical protein